MATSKKFSELPAASSVGNGDLFAIAHEDALAETGYVSQKLTAAQAGQKVNGDTEYPTSLPSFPENGQNPFAALEKLNQDIIDLYPVNTSSGSIANFTTSLEMPLVELSSTIVAQQAGSGTPSPSNPRAISGFDAVTITHEYGVSESETKTIALGQTVYGGVLDAKNGSATIDKALIVFDGSDDETWIYNSNYNGFSIPIPDMVSGNQLNGLCNWLEQVSSSASFGFRLGANNRALYCYHITDNISGVTDLATWKTYLSNNNLQIVFPLDTPTEITGLTGANFTTFASEQNIFSDCGEVSVSFKQGIQEYIDAQIAETQALIL